MTFQMVAYEKLRSSINESINTLIKHHKVNSVDKISNETRRNQVFFLQKIIELLDSSPDKSHEDKARVLNAASYYVYMQIKDSYEKTKLSYFCNKKNSNLFLSLYTSLNLREKNNKPDESDTFELYSSLLEFMELHTYQSDTLGKGFLLDLPFSAKDIKVLDSKVNTLKSKLLDVASVLHKKQLLDADKPEAKIEKQFNNANFFVENISDHYIESYSNDEKSSIESELEKKDEQDNLIEAKNDLNEMDTNIFESQSFVSSLSQSG